LQLWLFFAPFWVLCFSI